MNDKHVIVVGCGNAALCAGIAALDAGAQVTMLEKAGADDSGGNSRYTAGAMRFAYSSGDDILPLLRDTSDERLQRTDFGAYPEGQFAADMQTFNGERPLNKLQRRLVRDSYSTVAWLTEHNVRFDPIYARQTFEKNGQFVFWGGLTLEAQGEGVGLVDAEISEFKRLGGQLRFEADCHSLVLDGGRVTGVRFTTPGGVEEIHGNAVVLGCGGFEASSAMREELMGELWRNAKVRGTPHNVGAGLKMAADAGASIVGRRDGCHAVPMDRDMPDFGNRELPFTERKHYRKICYFLGIMLNAAGARFVDEGLNFRNYTYAQFGRAILEQPGNVAWQIFDQQVADLLYDEYRFEHASFVEAESIKELVAKMNGVDQTTALETIAAFNDAVCDAREFDPTVLDGKCTTGLTPNKSNWANRIDTPPFRAYPVTCGITFTYAGLKIDDHAAVINGAGARIPGLYACGELVGEVFFDGYPGGSGLTSGAVFGRLAGHSAANCA